MMQPQELTAQLDDLELERQARTHYTETSSYQAYWATRYELFHSYFAPLNGDQWPADRNERPGMIHVTHNIIAPAVMIESRIESRLPRVTLVPDLVDEGARTAAEGAERIHLRWLQMSGWKIWLNDLARMKSVYGKGVLKVRWDSKGKRPDVSVIETPQNLRIGWGSSDYSVMDWALYEYELSPSQVVAKFPNIEIEFTGRGKDRQINVLRHGDHSDPLSQKSVRIRTRTDQQLSDYEKHAIRVWDYWVKRTDTEGNEHIVNAFFVDGKLVQRENHDYLPDLPFIVVEHDHEMGSPEGIGDVEPLIDIQDELNRAFSHWSQLIADEIDPAYQVDADSVPGGIVPKNGQILAAGENKQIRPIEKSVQTFPVKELVEALTDAFHFRSGLSKILFTAPPGAQTAGRALQVQIEASANRIDPRRDRLYAGLEEVLLFWAHMAMKLNPKFIVGFDEQGKTVERGVAEALQITQVATWKFVAPEITPRDNLELITAVVNKLNAKIISLEAGMDELGVDSPLAMMKMIESERMNPRLYPGDVQGFMAAIAMLQQYQMTEAQLQQMGQGDPAAAAGGGNPAADAQGAAMAAAQASLPQGVQGDNGSGVPQPATAVGGPPPAGAPGPGGIQNQTLLRPTAGGGTNALNQIKLTTG